MALGGALGGLGRWGLDQVLPTGEGGFPWTTLVENVTGSLLLGVAMVLLTERRRPGRFLRPFLGTGVLGGFTTFSTYTGQTTALLLDGRAPLALTYLTGTLAACLLATWVGLAATRSVTGLRRPTVGGAR